MKTANQDMLYDILREKYSYLSETQVYCIIKLCWLEATYNMLDYMEKFFPMVRAEDRREIAGRMYWAAMGEF